MVHIYYTYCNDLNDSAEHPELLRTLPRERKEKILRYKSTEKRKQSLGASLLLDSVLNKYGFRIEQMHYSEHGKPEIEGLYFNISHSGDVAICVVSDRGSVGCDIEKIKQAPLGIVKRYFTDCEWQYMEGICEKDKNEAFYRLWTMKESYVKMTGEGMRIGLDSFMILPGESTKVYRGGSMCDCYIREYEVPGYKISVCAEENCFANEMEYLMV